MEFVQLPRSVRAMPPQCVLAAGGGRLQLSSENRNALGVYRELALTAVLTGYVFKLM